MDRTGYKKWRLDLAQMHGDIAGEIMASQGYEDAVIARVKDLLLKRSLKRDSVLGSLDLRAQRAAAVQERDAVMAQVRAEVLASLL